MISLTYPVPKIALLPLIFAWFGLGDLSKIVTITISVFYPIYISALAGAKSVSRVHVWAARNMGANRGRVLFEIVVPQVLPTLMVGIVLSIVTMLSVLSVPLMVAGSQPTMLTVDMAFRINAYGDYGVANALGVISYLMAAGAAWLYLRYSMRESSRP